MAPIAFYLDEHVQLALAEAMRARGVDVLTTQEAGIQNRLKSLDSRFHGNDGKAIYKQTLFNSPLLWTS